MREKKSAEQARKRAERIITALEKLVPDAGMILRSRTPWETLVAVELSAQCTDKKVNEVTERLFKKYKTLEDYVRADSREFERDIFQTGFYRNKTKNILAAARIVKEKFDGNVPRTMEKMLTIPGVGRKTANVVLGNAYGVVEGIAVDTHVTRLSRVFGLTRERTPEKIERDLMKLIPKKKWFRFTYLLIEYGRRFCPARKHNHKKCPLGKYSIGG
jgi:endonuclease-3